MKRLFNIMMVSVLAAFGMMSCTQEHIEVRYCPDKATAPVLGNIAGTTLSDGGAPIKFSYTDADYDIASSYQTVLYAALDNTFENKSRIPATLEKGSGTIKQSDLNGVLLSLGAQPEEVQELSFIMISNLVADNGQIYFDGGELRSNVVTAKFTPYNMAVPPTMLYNYVYVLGDYNGWSHESAQHLYDYTGSGNVYSGVIDFDEKAANGFKITGAASWDNATGNWGIGDAPEQEASSFVMANNGGDIKAYSKRFYQFTMNTSNFETPTLTKNWGADQIGIIGDFNNWNGDVVMSYNSYMSRFYADIDLASDTALKFRADGGWDLNWGVNCAQGGDNINVEAGKYRVYFNPAEETYEFASYMYGQPEPGADDFGGGDGGDEGDDPETTVSAGLWGVIGMVNGSSWDKDVYMTAADNGKWVSSVFHLDGEFKLRYNNEWKYECGLVSGETVTVGQPFKVTHSGGSNISAPAGLYYAVYDEPNMTITLCDATTGWGIIGDALVNAWDDDSYILSNNSGILTSAPVTFGAGGFKFRQNASWDVNLGGTLTALGASFAVTSGGENISTESYAGVPVIVMLDVSASIASVVPVFTDGRWGVIGNVNGSSWDKDILMWESNGVWKSAPFVADGGFKIRRNAGWDENYGGTFVSFGTPFSVTNGGDNIENAELAGQTVVLTFDPSAETITVDKYE